MSFYEFGKTEEFLLSLLPSAPEPSLSKVAEEAKKAGIPIVCDTGGQLLKLVTVMTRPARVLEIGTGIGYSGLIILLNSDARLYTVDFDEVSLERARKNFARFGMGTRARLYAGDAGDILPMIEGKFDLIFLDGPKGRYYEYLPYLIDLLPKGGVLLCDNVLYSGCMAGERELPHSKHTIADRLSIFLDRVSHDDRLITSVLPVGDGMSLSVRV